MTYRFVMLAVVLALVLAFAGGALAQDGVSEADLALYDAAFANVPTSTNFEASLTQDISVADEEITQTFAASGGYVFDTAGAAALVSSLDPTAFADPANIDTMALAETLKSAINLADAELFLSADVEGVPPMDISLWFVDGAGYVDLGPILGTPGIYGVDLNSTIDMGAGMLASMDLEALLNEAMADTGAFGDAMGPFGDFIAVFSDPTRGAALDAATTPYVSFERGADDADGNAVFATTVDVGGMLSDEVVVDLLVPYIVAQQQLTAELSGDPSLMLDEETASTAMNALGDAFAEGGLVVEQTVVIDPNVVMVVTFTQNTNMTADVDVLGQAIASFGGMDAEDVEPVGTLVLSQTLTFTRSNINAVESIAAPADATLLSGQDLMDLMMGQ